MSFVVARSFAEMETHREKSATPTHDYVVASSSAAAADGENTTSSRFCSYFSVLEF